METRKVIRAKTIFTGLEFIRAKGIVVRNGVIEAIVSEMPDDLEVLDFGEHTIAPGLIDLQIYGGGGYLFCNHLNGEALHAIADHLVRTGTTGFVLTLATNSTEVFFEAARVVREHPHPALLGLHFEGPYIHPDKRGAHLLQYIKQPTVEEVEQLLEKTADVLRIVTLAPECCSAEVIDRFTAAGVLVSAGHSNATFAEAQSAFSNGVRAATHLFNAMSPLHHRETGLPGAVYLHKSVCASIIADGIHVDFSTLRLSKQVMGERLFLITDAVDASSEGPYIHQRQVDRFTLPDGTLSGSTLTLLKAVQNCIEQAGIPFAEAWRMASLYPARLLQIPEYTGEISPGSWADLVVLDEHLNLKASMLRGEVVG